ncbi:hypothetical protein [Novosphingobium clariflavum]|uniref:Helix-turn-helix domain-containing protein n=1 Tax=Novosphingobium clariflavum TaxID=2029884 RepID=A0ABV6S1S2_9SPHN|nr:hypothetical protein [Novosphingobium clariflavum]
MQPRLSPAVAETLALRSQGLSVRHIARLRGVKPKTVRTTLEKHTGGVSPSIETIVAGSAKLAAAISAERSTP